MSRIEELKKEIELSRQHLYLLIEEYDFIDDKTIHQSQRLDDLLNKYNEEIVKLKS